MTALHIGDWFKRLFMGARVYSERWTIERTSPAFTDDERAAINGAFRKFDEAFAELDKAFKGWRS